MALEYYNLDFAKGRLENTIIKIGGKAAYISDVTGDQYLHYQIMATGEKGVINIRSEEVDVVPPIVGYVKLQGDWQFIKRRPERRWKQGLSLGYFDIHGEVDMRTVGSSLDGEFHNYNVVKASKRGTYAVSTYFAVRNGSLLYKGDVVGTVCPSGAVGFLEGKFWLKEAFEEALM